MMDGNTDKLKEARRLLDSKQAERVKKEREAFLDASRERLKTACLKKIDTTMIGALDAIEKELSELIGDCSNADQIMLKEAFLRARSKILDNGNNQKRAISDEIRHYIVDWQMYTITMPVKGNSEYDYFTLVEGKSE
jgi:DNA-binding transcriptional MerR regulator